MKIYYRGSNDSIESKIAISKARQLQARQAAWNIGGYNYRGNKGLAKIRSAKYDNN